ncbi:MULTISPECIES: MarR family winged helix-turn-helix transcriptional regulator [unclassified Janthinobacterium]|uniref:MarR family winged helix-turn-helix transcriptional regulator n=1 Tax=unclassified Janthinobacterium TaxID=2610881 RepID=UPI00034915B8|nr:MULTISPECIES: MarR family transcriptional regulator [unclassified Janthinobacterium]MEC5162652.1 DNA-binding MarR family transcriptional regulator [Janthinobacterium sp. CG_S6]
MRETNDNVNHSGEAQEEGVLDLIHTVMHQYRSQQYQVLRDGPHDITHMESKVLGFFGRQPGATQSDLARHSGRDKAQLARLIKGLRDKGLLDAEPDESDRRNVRLRLTSVGRSVQSALQQQATLLNAKAVQGLDGAQRRQLMALLQQVRRSLDAAV